MEKLLSYDSTDPFYCVPAGDKIAQITPNSLSLYSISILKWESTLLHQATRHQLWWSLWSAVLYFWFVIIDPR